MLALAAMGCAATETPPVVSPLDAERRKPDGVVLDPVSPPPAPRERASTVDQVVTLRTPLGVDQALATAGDLFRKIVLEDAEGLAALFTRDALAVPTMSSAMSGQPALSSWQQRLRKLDYTKLSGETVFREPEVEIFRADEAGGAEPPAGIHEDALAPNDIVLRVRILATHVGLERLFGDEMILWLRRDGSRFKVFRAFEEFQLN